MKNKKDEWNPNFVSRTKTMNASVDDIKKNNSFFTDSIRMPQTKEEAYTAFPPSSKTY